MDPTRDTQSCGTPKEACRGSAGPRLRRLLPVLLLLRPDISYALLLYEAWSQPDSPSLIRQLTLLLSCYLVGNRTPRAFTDNRS